MYAYRTNSKSNAAQRPHNALVWTVTLAVLLGGAPAAPACDVEVGPGATLKLSGDFVFDCVIVHAGGQLNLKSGSITITDPGGLTCDGIINIGTGAAAELVLAGSSPFASSTVNGTLKILPNGTLRLGAAERLSVSGTLTVNGAAVIGGGLTVSGQSSVSGSMTIEPTGGLGVTGGVTLPINGALTVDGSLRIDSTASSLVVLNGGTFSLDGQATIVGGGCRAAPASLVLANGGSSTVNGTVSLENCASAIVIEASDHTLTGTGTIVGKSNPGGLDNAARIVLSDSVALTSEILVVGALQIRANTGTFVNNGLVEANDASVTGSRDTLTLYSGTFAGTGEYTVNTSGANLDFGLGVAAVDLETDFTVGAGTLNFAETVRTSGDLTFTSGTITVNADKSFTAGGCCP